MIINNLNFKSILPVPHKADPVLPINADAVLALALAYKFLKSQTGPNRQIIQ